MRKLFIPLFAAASLLVSCKQETSIKQSPAKNIATTDSTAVKNGFPAGPIENTIMTPEYVKQMAQQIYLWAWPMVNIHNRKVVFQNLKEPVYMHGLLPIAPPNYNCMLTDYIEPEERDVACPNQDVAYGFGLLDLTTDAVIIQVPDFGDRFWVYQVCNQRTDGFANIGKMYGSKPGFYLLTAKGWKGKVPDGIIQTFECDTKFGCVIPRVFQNDNAEDKKAVQPIIQQIMMYPLSKFDGKMKKTDWTKITKTPAEPNGTKSETKWVQPKNFFAELPMIIDEVPPMPGEEALYGQVKSLLAAIAKNPKLMAAANEGAFEADKKLIDPLFQFVNVGYPVKNNWTTQKNGAQFGTDYLTRTACAKANIFVNKPNETKYFYQDLDSSGLRLNGSNKYTVTFNKGEVPPVKGFWSLTLYDEFHFFAPNSIKRFSLGTKNKDLKYNADGSLTLYVQNTSPSADKMSNWLPSPKEVFSLYIRCYWPEDKVIQDVWTPPAVLKVK